MRAKVKKIKQKASQLHGASATYVSLVDRGAAETPFTVIKAAKGDGAMGIKKRTQKSHKKVDPGTQTKADDEKLVTKTVMAKMLFDQDLFEDEAAVREWIEKAEWEADGIEITDSGDGFYVARPEGTTDESFARIGKVDTETDGVEAYVGEMQVKADDEEPSDDDDATDDDTEEDDADDNADAGDEPATETKVEDKPKKPLSKRAEFIAKSAQKIVKFDGWDAFYSKKSDLAESIKAGMAWDKTPPGFYDVQAAFNGTIAGILGSEDLDTSAKQGALTKAAGEYADIISGLDMFFDTFVNASEDTMTKAVGDEARESIAKWAEGYAQFVASEGADVGAATQKKADKPIREQKAAEPKADFDVSKIEDLIKKAVEPLSTQVNEVVGTVQKMADRRPSKKSVDLTDNTPDPSKVKKSEAEQTDDWMRSKQRKSVLGGR